VGPQGHTIAITNTGRVRLPAERLRSTSRASWASELTSMAGLRVSVKAVIIRNGRILVTANRDRDGMFFLLPGGGRQFGEPLSTALRRECNEEVGVDVEVHELVLVRDYISANHEFAD